MFFFLFTLYCPSTAVIPEWIKRGTLSLTTHHKSHVNHLSTLIYHLYLSSWSPSLVLFCLVLFFKIKHWKYCSYCLQKCRDFWEAAENSDSIKSNHFTRFTSNMWILVHMYNVFLYNLCMYIVHCFSVRWRLLKAEQETNSVFAFITLCFRFD